MKNDEVAMRLIDSVREQKSLISGAEKKKYCTNCVLNMGDGPPINLHVVSSLEELCSILSRLLSKNHFHRLSCGELGLPITNLSFGGYDLDDWVADIKTKSEKIRIGEKKKRLAELESKLQSLVSDEKRKELELLAISKELGIEDK